MTTTIRVIFDESDDGLNDRITGGELKNRLDAFEQVMARSATPWDVHYDYTFDDVGGINGYMFVFHINEFYEQIVKDLLANMCHVSWVEWFCDKYKLVSA